MASSLQVEFSKFCKLSRQLRQILRDTQRYFQDINTAGNFGNGKLGVSLWKLVFIFAGCFKNQTCVVSLCGHTDTEKSMKLQNFNHNPLWWLKTAERAIGIFVVSSSKWKDNAYHSFKYMSNSLFTFLIDAVKNHNSLKVFDYAIIDYGSIIQQLNSS